MPSLTQRERECVDRFYALLEKRFGERLVEVRMFGADIDLLVVTTDEPSATEQEELIDLCRGILDGPGGGGSVALMMSRPGGGAWTVSDRAWGRFLLRGAEELGEPVWPVHLAHSHALERFRLPERRR